VGARGSLLEETPESARLVKFRSPILTPGEMDWLRKQTDPAFRACTLEALFPVAPGPEGLEPALEALCVGLCRYLAHQTAGIYQIDGNGFFADEGTLLVSENG